MKNENPVIIKKNRILFLTIFSFIIFLIIIGRISYLQLFNTKASINNLNNLSTKKVYGPQMPRGKIYDRNYNVIVDNLGIYVLCYKKNKNVTVKDEIKLAYELSNNIQVDYNNLKQRNLKEFWIENNLKKAEKKNNQRRI